MIPSFIHQTITATESGTTATTKHAILLSTYHHLRLAQLSNRIIQPSRPRGRSHSQCCCVAFPGAAVIVITTTSFSFSHACASAAVSWSLFSHLFLHKNIANKAHNGGYLTQGSTLLLIVVIFECNPTRAPGRPALCHSLPRWRVRFYPRAWYRYRSAS